jgi:hypothetical protein
MVVVPRLTARATAPPRVVVPRAARIVIVFISAAHRARAALVVAIA